MHAPGRQLLDGGQTCGDLHIAEPVTVDPVVGYTEGLHLKGLQRVLA